MIEEIERRVQAYSAAIDWAARQLLDSAPEYVGLYDMLRYHLGWWEQPQAASHSGGKRLRSNLCLAAAECAGADWQVALPAATAVELLHNFSLIHDDIEDRSRFRRHRETVWARWGTAQAINAGDGLLIVANQALFETEPRLFPEVGFAASRLLNRTCRELCEGQHLDLRWENAPSITVEEYLGMVERKTARLFECAARLGGLCAAAPRETQQQLGLFARAVGMAFQVADDILGIWSPQNETGKTAALDVVSRKKTLPITLALANLDRPSGVRLRELFSRDRLLEEDEAAEAIGLLDDLRVRDEALRALSRFRDEALEHLSSAGLRGGTGLLSAFVQAALPQL